MCYREPPDLDLEPIQVACLCGPNGHGKSALLDAITWALWSKARALTQDELIHQGQTDMAVELDFSARDRRYRVSRRHFRKRGKQGAAMLELQVASNGSYTPITGNTVRETESAIRELLHMDYDTFVNTAFLLQGRADMFTAATPSKRKEVLAEVLDLGYYESLAVKVREGPFRIGLRWSNRTWDGPTGPEGEHGERNHRCPRHGLQAVGIGSLGVVERFDH